MMKRALVTGGSGFVAGHLIPLLHRQGFEVWASYHRHPKKFPFRVHWVRTDLTDSRDALELIRKSRPHFFFHLAAQTVPQESWRNPAESFKVNVGASIGLLEGILRFAREARSVWVSSTQVYGTSFLRKKAVREEDLASPVSPYGGSKLLMELAALNFSEMHRLEVIVARASNQAGQGQNETGVFSDFSRRIALIEAGKIPPLLKVGNLEVARDFLHVEDAVRAYELLARRGRRGEIYNVSSGRGMRVKEGLDFLARRSRVPFRIKAVSTRFRRNDYPRTVASPDKLKKLGWRPQRPIQEALRELLEEWRGKVASGLL
jgi:GDP-4-dehydro-6-deoxy-D-mannose reductase